MAGSTKAGVQTSVYTEGKSQLGHSAVGSEKESKYIIGPGLDQFYELIDVWGLAFLVFASVALSFWVVWAVDFSGGK